MLNIIGIFIIILGFLPTDISFGYVPSIIFFWVGILLALQPNKKIPYLNSIIRPARIGLLVSVLAFAFGLIFYSHLIYNLPPGKKTFWFISLVGSAISPIYKLADLFFPQPTHTLPDGSVTITTTYIRVAVINFLNLMLYISVSIIINNLIKTKKNS